MIGYTSLGTNDLNRSAGFYDELFKALGIGRLMEVDDFIVWGQDMSSVNFSIHLPIDGNSASVGNGVMIALRTKNREEVDRVYAKALEIGGMDEGAPGPRGDYGFYAAYFRDLDGNKLNLHCIS
ncbi:VOC family protein [Kiloniella sp.]|uniref:VOC family protein n=1 Tax=Kiloniella sp. TaxID=1938587 RepID=UPI003B010312